MTETILTPKECEKLIGKSKTWLNATRAKAHNLYGSGPPFYKRNNGWVVYKRDEVLKWLRDYGGTRQCKPKKRSSGNS